MAISFFPMKILKANLHACNTGREKIYAFLFLLNLPQIVWKHRGSEKVILLDYSLTIPLIPLLKKDMIFAKLNYVNHRLLTVNCCWGTFWKSIPRWVKSVFVSFKVCYTATSISLSKQSRGGRRVIFPLATAANQLSPTNIQALAFYRCRHKKKLWF